MKHFRLLSWIFLATAVLTACEEDDTTPPAEPQQLAKPALTVADRTTDSFTVTWPAVEHAASYAYRVVLDDETGTVLINSEIEGGGNPSLPIDGLQPETAYNVFVTAKPSAEETMRYTASETAELSVTTLPEAVPELPGGMFEIELGITSYEGIQFTFKPKDPLMLYTDILIDELYLTEDGLTDEDFTQQIIETSNEALQMYGSLEKAREAEFFYMGEYSGVGFGGKTPGTRLFFAVMGVEYDEATNTVSPVTKISRSEIFEVTDEALPAPEEPWADMLNPVYETYRGNDVVSVEIAPNETGVGYAYGKVYPADYRKSHSDYEIIQELTSMDNMGETWISDWDLHLRGQMAPGEQRLFAVTCLYKDSGKLSSKLNWMILEAPDAVGGKVRVVDSASGEKDPEPAPDPSEVTFETSVKVEGAQVSYTITPSDPDAYYFVHFRTKEELTTPEDDAAAVKNLIDYFNQMMYLQHNTVEEYIAAEGDLFKGATTQTETDWDPGEYYLIYVAVEIKTEEGGAFPIITAEARSEPGKTPFTVEAGGVDPEPSAITFEMTANGKGKTVTYSITPSKPDVYYFVDFIPAADLASPEQEAAVLQEKIDDFNQQMGPTGQFSDIATYMERIGDLFDAPAAGLQKTFSSAAAGDYYIYCFAAEITVEGEGIMATASAKALTGLNKTSFTLE